jgi:hypothetical protein
VVESTELLAIPHMRIHRRPVGDLVAWAFASRRCIDRLAVRSVFVWRPEAHEAEPTWALTVL